MIRITSTGGIPLVYQSDNSWGLPTATGAVQWNGATKALEVSTGTGWTRIDANITLDTTPSVSSILKWAQRKMAEEEDLRELAKTNPTIADLLATIADAKEKIEVVRILTKPETVL